MLAVAAASVDDLANIAYHQDEMREGGLRPIDKFSLAAPIAGDFMRTGEVPLTSWRLLRIGRGAYPTVGSASARAFGPTLPRGVTPGTRFFGLFQRNLQKDYALRLEERVLRSAGERYSRRGIRGGASALLGSRVGRQVLLSKVGGALLTAGNVAFLAPLALDLGRAAGAGLSYLGEDRGRLDFGSTMIDTEQAYTQRQAALMAIHNSQLNTRSFFGREAQAFHR